MHKGIDVEYFISQHIVLSQVEILASKDRDKGKVAWIHHHPQGEECVPDCFDKVKKI